MLLTSNKRLKNCNRDRVLCSAQQQKRKKKINEKIVIK